MEATLKSAMEAVENNLELMKGALLSGNPFPEIQAITPVTEIKSPAVRIERLDIQWLEAVLLNITTALLGTNI